MEVALGTVTFRSKGATLLGAQGVRGLEVKGEAGATLRHLDLTPEAVRSLQRSEAN